MNLRKPEVREERQEEEIDRNVRQIGKGESRREKQVGGRNMERRGRGGQPCSQCSNTIVHAIGQLRSSAAHLPQGVPDKGGSHLVLRWGPGGFGRKEQTCGGGAQGPKEAGGPLRSGLLGLIEPLMLMGLEPHQFCGATDCRQ